MSAVCNSGYGTSSFYQYAYSDWFRRQDSKIWPSGLFKLLYMCVLILFFPFFFPSSRKWVFLLNWLFVEWHQMALQLRIQMTEACWIYVALIQELLMLFETLLWIWSNFLGICSSQWVHCWQQTTPWELPAKYTSLEYGTLYTYQNVTFLWRENKKSRWEISFLFFSCCTQFK